MLRDKAAMLGGYEETHRDLHFVESCPCCLGTARCGGKQSGIKVGKTWTQLHEADRVGSLGDAQPRIVLDKHTDLLPRVRERGTIVRCLEVRTFLVWDDVLKEAIGMLVSARWQRVAQIKHARKKTDGGKRAGDNSADCTRIRSTGPIRNSNH